MNRYAFAPAYEPAWLTWLHHWAEPASTWRQASIAGAYVPTLMIVFCLCAALTWLIDLAVARIGIYQFIWHPPLFRVSLFVCLFSVAGVALYG
jgi:hypothetical protein